MLKKGKEMGFLCTVIARPTRQEAEEYALSLLKKLQETDKLKRQAFRTVAQSEVFNSVLDLANDKAWVTPTLWTGLVPYMGPLSIALFGSYQEVAEAILNYKKEGITQFLLVGYPDKLEMTHFAEGVLPIIKKLETNQFKDNTIKPTYN